MSKSIKTLALVGLVAGVAACAKAPANEEFVVVDAQPVYEPISYEPTYTGKYK